MRFGKDVFEDMRQSGLPKNHYLDPDGKCGQDYADRLFNVLDKLSKKLDHKKFAALINKKLQLRVERFCEPQYVQIACEVAAMADFLDREDIVFDYEKKVSPPGDVDFSISRNGISINVEVKCASYLNIEDEDPNRIVATFLGRTDFREDILRVVSAPLAENGLTMVEGKNRDNTVKGFLKCSQKKMLGSSLDDINVVILCCDSALDVQQWRGYLVDSRGILTGKSPLLLPAEIDRIDFVLVTNLFDRNFGYRQDQVPGDNWSLGDAFCLLYPNRFSKRNINLVDGSKDFDRLGEIFPNHSRNFEDFMRDDLNVPEGESPEMKLILGVAWFSDGLEEKGMKYFSSKG